MADPLAERLEERERLSHAQAHNIAEVVRAFVAERVTDEKLRAVLRLAA